MFGSIDANCEIAPIVESAYNAARDICEYHYMSAPELDFKTVNGVPGDETPAQKIKFVYVPAHLYHILFELIKNSMRATIERHGEATVYLPPIKSKLGIFFSFAQWVTVEYSLQLKIVKKQLIFCPFFSSSYQRPRRCYDTS